jgi:hypothetical protein
MSATEYAYTSKLIPLKNAVKRVAVRPIIRCCAGKDPFDILYHAAAYHF